MAFICAGQRGCQCQHCVSGGIACVRNGGAVGDRACLSCPTSRYPGQLLASCGACESGVEAAGLPVAVMHACMDACI